MSGDIIREKIESVSPEEMDSEKYKWLWKKQIIWNFTVGTQVQTGIEAP